MLQNNFRHWQIWKEQNFKICLPGKNLKEQEFGATCEAGKCWSEELHQGNEKQVTEGFREILLKLVVDIHSKWNSEEHEDVNFHNYWSEAVPANGTIVVQNTKKFLCDFVSHLKENDSAKVLLLGKSVNLDAMEDVAIECLSEHSVIFGCQGSGRNGFPDIARVVVGLFEHVCANKENLMLLAKLPHMQPRDNQQAAQSEIFINENLLKDIVVCVEECGKQIEEHLFCERKPLNVFCSPQGMRKKLHEQVNKRDFAIEPKHLKSFIGEAKRLGCWGLPPN